MPKTIDNMTNPSRYRLTRANLEDSERHENNLSWAMQWRESANGVYYSSELSGPDGMHYTLYTHPGFGVSQVEGAIDELKYQHDVTGITVLGFRLDEYSNMVAAAEEILRLRNQPNKRTLGGYLNEAGDNNG